MHDRILRDAVIAAVDAITTGAPIGVAARHGVVTLFGRASPAEREAVEAAARATRGAHVVLNCVQSDEAVDPDVRVAEAIASFLERTDALAGDAVAATVYHRCVALFGDVASGDQRALAERELRSIPGVLNVDNHLCVLKATTTDHRATLLELLGEQGIAADGLRIAVVDGVATLSGRMQHWFDRDAAERLAWSLPGVQDIINDIELPAGAVRPDDESGETVADI